jgi:hypothetical protein
VTGVGFALVPVALMIALAVFYGIENKSPAVIQLITELCDAAVASSPFNNVSVQNLQNDCLESTLAAQSRSILWTAVRAALQVSSTFILH